MISITVVDMKCVIISRYQSTVIPRVKEAIYSGDNGKSYDVLHVAHHIANEKQSGATVIVEEKNERRTK